MRAENYFASNPEHRVQEWLARLAKEVPVRPLRLVPERAVLLVIDAMAYFADPDGPAFVPAAPYAVTRMAHLLTCWRDHGGTAVFTRHEHADDGGAMGRFFRRLIRTGDPFARIVAPLRPRDGETVLVKDTYDAFLRTGLDEVLRSAGATQVVVCGLVTHMCCETTARSAFCRGYDVFFPIDATATWSADIHYASVRNLATCAAVVRSADDIARAWNDDRPA